MLKRTLFKDEHHQFREAFSRWCEDQLKPHYEVWEEEGQIPRSVWQEAAKQGFVGLNVAEEFGGVAADFLYSAVIAEQLYYHAMSSFFLPLHNDIVLPYLMELGTSEQKAKYLPSCVSAETITALALTEPNYGSDLARLQTQANETDYDFVLSGSKTFISNGQSADLFVVAARTQSLPESPHRGISLFLVESATPGFRRGRNLNKIGLHAQDTSEIFFDQCRIPKSNLLGERNRGFYYLMQNLQQERLVIAIGAVAAAWGCLDLTKKYVKQRSAFGSTLSQLPTIRRDLALLEAQVQMAQSFVDDLIGRHVLKENITKEVSMAKALCTDLQFSVADRCLQMFGGYGYMREYPISRHFVDARVQRIYGGANEIMLELVARDL